MDAHYLDQAMALAALGRGGVEPNPMVGCVIVRNGRVIGTGYHQRFGGSHAEPMALANCSEPIDGATVYVTLEPCCHVGKKTPPCVPQLIAARVGRVVIGCLDPNPAVAGMGAAQLRAGGIDVTVGIREAESKQLNAPFFAVQREHRPYVTLKWAESADGKVAGAGGRRMQISGPEAQRASHLLRSRFDAILVGIGTALVDDPLLTTRRAEPHRTLARIVLDSSLRLSPASRLATTAREHATHVFSVAGSNDPGWTQRAMALQAAGVHIHPVTPDANGHVHLAAVMNVLADELHVTHLMVEGGPAVQEGFLKRNLADRAWVIRSSLTIGALDAPKAAALPEDFAETTKLVTGSDSFTEYLNPGSPVYFETRPSADVRALGA